MTSFQFAITSRTPRICSRNKPAQSLCRADIGAPDRHVEQFRNRKQAERDAFDRHAVEQVGVEHGRRRSSANWPDCASSPTAASSTPNTATISPLSIAPWLTEATSVSPSMHTASSSGVPIASMNGRRIGIETASSTAPIQSAHDRGTERCPEGAPGLAALGHRMPVKHGRGRSDRARHAEQDRRHGVGGRRHRPHADQEGERRMGVHRMGERDQQRHPAEAADARQHADDQAEARCRTARWRSAPDRARWSRALRALSRSKGGVPLQIGVMA